MTRLAFALAFTAVVAACASEPALPTDTPVALPTLPPGERESVRVNEVDVDGRTVTARFTGGPAFGPADWCSLEYAMDATVVAGELQVTVYSIRRGTPPSPRQDGVLLTCNAMGYDRVVSVELERPFLGTVVRDLAGSTHLLAPPAELVVLRDLPADWTLVAQDDVADSPTGRWMRRWALRGDPDRVIELYQAFDGPASVTGGEEISQVDVGGELRTLYRQLEVGELVLVWSVGTDGVALVANERDFSEEELIRLAESADCPRGCR